MDLVLTSQHPWSTTLFCYHSYETILLDKALSPLRSFFFWFDTIGINIQPHYCLYPVLFYCREEKYPSFSLFLFSSFFLSPSDQTWTFICVVNWRFSITRAYFLLIFVISLWSSTNGQRNSCPNISLCFRWFKGNWKCEIKEGCFFHRSFYHSRVCQ